MFFFLPRIALLVKELSLQNAKNDNFTFVDLYNIYNITFVLVLVIFGKFVVPGTVTGCRRVPHTGIYS